MNSLLIINYVFFVTILNIIYILRSVLKVFNRAQGSVFARRASAFALQASVFALQATPDKTPDRQGERDVHPEEYRSHFEDSAIAALRVNTSAQRGDRVLGATFKTLLIR